MREWVHVSLPAVRRCGWSFENVTVRTMCLCWKLWVSSPVSAFHTFAEKSAEAVAATSAVSFKTHDQTAPWKHGKDLWRTIEEANYEEAAL